MSNKLINPKESAKVVDNVPKIDENDKKLGLVNLVPFMVIYVNQDGDKIGEETKTAIFVRSAEVNKKTDKIVSYSDWSEPQALSFEAPRLEGYELSDKSDTEINITVKAGESAKKCKIIYDEVDDSVLAAENSKMNIDDADVIELTSNQPGVPGEPVDPNNPDGMKYPETTGEKYLVSVTPIKIKYVMEDGSTAPTSVDFQIKFTRDGYLNTTTGEVSYSAWRTDKENEIKIESPKVTGYNPDVTFVDSTIIPGRPFQQVITYHADAQHAQVNFIDETTDTVLNNIEVTGKTNHPMDDVINKQINDYLGAGYVLVDNRVPDNFESVDYKKYDVTLKHEIVNVSFGKPGKPGEPIDSNRPNTMLFPYGTDRKGLSNQTKVKFVYQFEDGRQADLPKVITVDFDRKARIDLTTGQVHYNEWQATNDDKHSNTVEVSMISPTIEGYTPDNNDASVAVSAQNPVEKVITYSAQTQTASINFVNENGKVIANDTVQGHSDEVVAYDSSAVVKTLEDMGYVVPKVFSEIHFGNSGQIQVVKIKEAVVALNHANPKNDGSLVNDGNPTGPKYPAGVAQNDLNKSVNFTVKYQTDDDTPAPAENTKVVQFFRDARVNLVTKDVTYTAWTTIDNTSIESPAMSGYLPDQRIVSFDGSVDDTKEVVYAAQTQMAKIVYLDTKGEEVLSDMVRGKSNTSVAYDSSNSVQTLINRGYNVPKLPTKIRFETTDQTVSVKLTDNIVSVDHTSPKASGLLVDPSNVNGPKYPAGVGVKDLNNDTTVTVHYQTDNGATAPANASKTVHFSRDAEIDLVSGKVTYTPWTTSESTSVDIAAPDMKGYTPATETVHFDIVAGQDDIKNVVYTANKQLATITYVTATGKVLAEDTIGGRSNETVRYNSAETVKALRNKGYDVSNVPSQIKFGTENTLVKVQPAEGITLVTPEKPGKPGEAINAAYAAIKYPAGSGIDSLVKHVTRTINFVDAQGNAVAAPNISTVEFKRDAKINRVTGKVAYTTWTTANAEFKAVKAPVVKGYFANKAMLPSAEVDKSMSNVKENIQYGDLGQLVPDVPGVEPITYPNNPNFANAAIDPMIPTIPGYVAIDQFGDQLIGNTPYPIDHANLGQSINIHFEKDSNSSLATPSQAPKHEEHEDEGSVFGLFGRKHR
ncbi:mucin-binding protein [Fructilactobacillus sp. Tb1]|uniref:mucin-binding protein n=1 Tax=Fructilactobacillus sp. Tb1 TaxID=3422304 RepID=UPI003D28CA19